MQNNPQQYDQMGLYQSNMTQKEHSSPRRGGDSRIRKTQESEAKQVQRAAKTYYIIQKYHQKKCKITTRRWKMTINGNTSVLLLWYSEAPGVLRCRCPGVHSCPRLLHASVTVINTFQHDKWPWKWISAISSTSLEPFPQALAFITVWFPHFYFGCLCLCPWCNEKCWISTQDLQHCATLADI